MSDTEGPREFKDPGTFGRLDPKALERARGDLANRSGSSKEVYAMSEQEMRDEVLYIEDRIKHGKTIGYEIIRLQAIRRSLLDLEQEKARLESEAE